MNDFVPEAPEVEGATQPTPSDTPSISNPTETKEWNKCENLLQLFRGGYTYFVSSTRNANGQFQYTLEIKSEDTVEFKGKDANGNDINKTYVLGSSGNQNYTSNEDARLRFGSKNNIEDKYIEFKPHNMQNYIKFSLAKKS